MADQFPHLSPCGIKLAVTKSSTGIPPPPRPPTTGLGRSVERLTAKREAVVSIHGARPVLRNGGTPVSLQTAGPSRGSDDHVKWQSRLH